MVPVIVVVGLVVVGLAVAGVVYRDQIGRRATHLKGGPRHTVAWAPFGSGGAERPRVHLAVVGDVGDGGARLRATARAITALHAIERFDGLVVAGDNVYPSGDPGRLPETVFRPFADLLADAELYAVLGNHDVKRGHAAGQVAALGMPGRWWAHHLDDVLLIGLDSNRPRHPDQRAWLDETLASATETWRIVVLHHPPYSAGYQGSDHAVRRAFVPLFERHGVQLVVSGHDHDYQRSVPLGGVTYVVTGGAAGSRRTGEEDFTAVSFAWHHFVELAVFGDRLVLRAVDPAHRVADEAILTP